MKMNKFKITTLLLSTLLLASCDGDGGGASHSGNPSGGGSSDNSTDSGNPDTTKKAPSINAGADQSVERKSSVTIASVGTDADGRIVSYLWSQISGTNVDMDKVDKPNVSFTAPDISTPETLKFNVLVTDNDGLTASDQVDIHVGIPVKATGKLRMPKIVYVASVSRGEVVISWQPTLNSDETELQAGVSYSIHASQTENFSPEPQTLKKTEVTELNTVVTGLEPNKTYYFSMVAENSTDQSVSGEKKVIVSNTKIKLIDGIKAVKNSEIKSSLKDITDGKLKLDSSDDLNAGDIIVDEKTGMAVRIKSVDSKSTAETEPANLGSIFDSVDGDWSAGGRFKADLK